MRVSREREKLINAMVFFAENTNMCGKIKLFKLLYLLDFEHFAETGLSVTGLEYQAWENGPVPRALYDEWRQPRGDFTEAVSVSPVQAGRYLREEVRPRVVFDSSDFTKRELRIMRTLAEKHKDHTAEQIIEATHVDNGAWAKVWQLPGNDNVIPYAFAVSEDHPHRAAILQTAEEHAKYQP